MIKDFILYYSADLPEIADLCISEKRIILKPLEKWIHNGKAQFLNETPTAFILSHTFLKDNSFWIRESPLPDGCVVVYNPETRPIPEAIPESLIYQELYGFSVPEAAARTLRNLYRQSLLTWEVRQKDKLIKDKDKIFKEVLEVGIALSAERDNDKLLEAILLRLREMTGADAGSLYLLLSKKETEEQFLLFKIAQNDSNPSDFTEFKMPVDTKSLAGYVAVHGKSLNIPDVYDIPPETGVVFNRSFDNSTGYRSKSILTVPMIDHKGSVLGVVQLINRKRNFSVKLDSPGVVDREVIVFDRENESLALSLSSMAAVALENNNLYTEIETLFEGFVKASVKAIESRDPTTSGHSGRVALYTVGLAETVDRITWGPYGNVNFNRDQIKEIRYASLLHDFGKVGVRENVLVKAKKLYPAQLQIIQNRFDFIQRSLELEYMRKKYLLLKERGVKTLEEQILSLEVEEKRVLKEIKDAYEVVLEANEPNILEEEPAARIKMLAQKVYRDITGKELPLLLEPEVEMLSIRRGSLNEIERKEIESHVIHTYEFLKNIPWTSTLKEIPTIARWHHEKLNGEGYPDKVTRENIPLQTKMMTISDIYDALTARDRPYKRAVPMEKALEILISEVSTNHLDKDLVNIFIDSKIYLKVDNQN